MSLKGEVSYIHEVYKALESELKLFTLGLSRQNHIEVKQSYDMTVWN